MKRQLRSVMAQLAAWIVHRPHLKQWALTAVDHLPASMEQRLRRLAAPNRNGSARRISNRSPLQQRWQRDLAWRRKLVPPAGKRLQLAIFSPLPPEKSGISSYTQMLVPRLARHFDIHVIVNQPSVSAEALARHCEVRDYDWFKRHAGQFDRILYQVGNAHFHSHMFEALARWPGVVMLHDFYLGHLVRHMDYADPGLLVRTLYREQGYTALARHSGHLHDEEIVWEHPLNAGILDHALGIIAHSPFSQTLANRTYGSFCRQEWIFIPHLKEPASPLTKACARAQLGIPPEAFVVCSFGLITPTKLHHRLLQAWDRSRLAQNADCQLIFVGEQAHGEHGRKVGEQVRLKRASRVQVTGWADTEIFETYLAAADVAVQLRSRSRGETSGAVIDCLNQGLATIVNAHGTMQDLPRDAVCLLPDDFTDAQLTSALERLHDDPVYRDLLGTRGQALICTGHDPERCALDYYEGIERLYARQAPRFTLVDAHSDPDGEHMPPPSAWQPPVDALIAPLRQPQLMVDVSAISHHDLQTGIERVVRAQLLTLIAEPPEQLRVEPVCLLFNNGLWRYHYARDYACHLLDIPNPHFTDEPVDFYPGDCLYLPDLDTHSTVEAARQGVFEEARARGIRVHVLLHDILPVTLPHMFPPGAAERHETWLQAISGFASQVICISHAVAQQYRDWLQKQELKPPAITVNHHGADIDASRPSRGAPRYGRKVLAHLQRDTTFLMVGTIEPRKGHLEALDAFEELWRIGAPVNLVIIGREGWKNLPTEARRTIPETIRRLSQHPQRGKRLFWLTNISDDYLKAVYEASDCLVAASYDEGFGLPLIEAAAQNLAIIARDIAVFREVAGDCAIFFSNDYSLASAVTDYLQHRKPLSPIASILTWSQNVERLKELLLTGVGRDG